MNEKQALLLSQYGLTEDDIKSGNADLAHRLEFANRADSAAEVPPIEVEPESEPVEKPTAAQAELLRNLGLKNPADLTPAQKNDYDFWGKRGGSTDTPAEAAKTSSEEPVVLGPHTEFDIEKIADLSPWRRNAIADHIRVLRAGLPTHATLNDQHSLAQAKLYLGQFVLKK
ncbi:hypothetical protein NKH86_11900 [Mesorhizobium sp. M0913]|uniref:hypothetical protein n=1 Tax=Mesorhizobium sp. M0913 TaxID=2957026 RepID=UPI00333A2E13